MFYLSIFTDCTQTRLYLIVTDILSVILLGRLLIVCGEKTSYFCYIFINIPRTFRCLRNEKTYCSSYDCTALYLSWLDFKKRKKHKNRNTFNTLYDHNILPIVGLHSRLLSLIDNKLSLLFPFFEFVLYIVFVSLCTGEGSQDSDT